MARQIHGTQGNDILFGSEYVDDIYGYGGVDFLYAGKVRDNLYGGADSDFLFGNVGGDRLDGGSGDDWLSGGAGNDWMIGGTGADTMLGGADNDYYLVDSVGDVVAEYAGGGDHDDVRVTLSSYTIPAEVEAMIYVGDGDTFVGIGDADDNFLGAAKLGLVDQAFNPFVDLTFYGNQGDDSLQGARGDDTLYGGGDDDWLWGDDGKDTLEGGAGADQLAGEAGRDTLTGGSGADVFRYFATSDSPTFLGDKITDFVEGVDEIDIDAIDADLTTGGDQAFAFIGKNGFTKAGQLQIVHTAGGDTYVNGETTGDGIADFQIRLLGHIDLTAGDFSL